MVKHVEVEGVRMAYSDAGEGMPLLLVHGNYASKRWFREQLAGPPAGWRLIAPDLPNFADSEAMPGPVEIGSYAHYLAAFCDALGLEAVALLGHSMGGAVAQELATAQPGRVTRLLLVSSAAPDGHVTPEEHYAVLEGLKGNREALATALAATMPTRQPPYFDEIVDDALEMREHAYVGNGRALERFDVSGRTANYSGPVLVIRGEHDLPHLITEEIARRTADAYRNARLELWEGVGHSPPIEAPERFNRTLARFLGEQP